MKMPVNGMDLQCSRVNLMDVFVVFKELGWYLAIESNISNATGRHTADALIDGHFVMVQDCITFAEINN
ncbi:MAG: hypothetical protein A2169_04190 [Deltaproteobacteria bacterium RBG_13_47_9]|nr:MAG: hypothetical protein A2169_04190 [Deltaproteobacteria bacterium RBG_13_47_9]